MELYVGGDCYLPKEVSSTLIRSMNLESNEENFIKVQDKIIKEGLSIYKEKSDDFNLGEMPYHIYTEKKATVRPLNLYVNYFLGKRTPDGSVLNCYMLYPNEDGVVYKQYFE